ncbi:glycosyltransferase family 1 protein [Paenibacillus sp. RC67]|uniref:glycosyltransferase family 4 protein n=1 Tax=Paenibacillus sp. RC67 TaxID=3039392 RepID=UPI0024ADB81D|nr:glycosyltransferase family 1 protein [Paenibacillus sp. RC67]
MKLAIYSSMHSLGGGSRLLVNLVTAIARHPDVQSVRLIVASQTGLQATLNRSQHPKLEVVYYDNPETLPAGHPFLIDRDLVYVFWPHGSEYQIWNKPTVVTYHDATILDYVPPFTSGAYIRSYWESSKQWLEHCEGVVVSSEHVKSRLIAHFGDRCRQAAVIRHAISPAKYFENSETSSILSAAFPSRYFIYPANTSPHKNHYNLLLAYTKFSKRSEHPLILIGYNTDQYRSTPPAWPEISYLPTIVSLIKRLDLKINQDLFPLGMVPDDYVSPLIKNAHALIMPSLSEGGGSYPVEEALSMGVPVLCSDIPVMREHLANRSAKVVWFEPESPDSITNAMEHLAEHYDEFKASVVAGMNDPAASWDDIAAQYAAVFHNVLNNKRG